jgi:pyridoxine 5-phosphate synthase
MARLGVNIDHVATLREARKTYEPDPVTAAALMEMAGADGITVHLREDRRHIQDRDLRLLKETVTTHLNLEMAATSEMTKIALYIKPAQCTLVPEKREEITTEGGLDVVRNFDQIKKTVTMLKDGDIRTSLFVDPELDQIKASYKTGVDAVEIHTGRYADAKTPAAVKEELEAILNAVRALKKFGLGVHAGHGLNYHNMKALVAIPDIEEFNIGHAILSRAIFVGISQAVREMVDIIRGV